MELDTDNLVELLSEALFRKHAIEVHSALFLHRPCYSEKTTVRQ